MRTGAPSLSPPHPPSQAAPAGRLLCAGMEAVGCNSISFHFSTAPGGQGRWGRTCILLSSAPFNYSWLGGLPAALSLLVQRKRGAGREGPGKRWVEAGRALRSQFIHRALLPDCIRWMRLFERRCFPCGACGSPTRRGRRGNLTGQRVSTSGPQSSSDITSLRSHVTWHKLRQEEFFGLVLFWQSQWHFSL